MVEIVRENRTAVTDFGAAELARALEAAGCRLAPSAERVRLTLSGSLGPEAFRLRRAGGELVVEGGDERGLMYGAIDLD